MNVEEDIKMKKLYLYPIPILFSYLLFDGMNMVSIWTFILPIVITASLAWTQGFK